MLNTATKNVHDFHDRFEVNIEQKPIIPGKNRCVLRQKLLAEELEEFKTAWQNGDLLEAADALADLQYVLLGTVLEFGLQDYFSEIFAEVHRANMSKLDKNGNAIYRADGKVMKSDLFSPPNLKQIIFQNKTKP